MRIVLAERVYRIGRQTVELEDGKYWLTITNRTYHSEHRVEYETAMRYLKALKEESR